MNTTGFMPGVTGANWLIIGGSGGLGKAVAQLVVDHFKAAGTNDKVVITSRTRSKAAQIAEELGAKWVVPEELDATDSKSVQALWERIRPLKITRYVDAAGGGRGEARTPANGSVLDIPLDGFEIQLQTTLMATVNCMAIIGNGMLKDQQVDGKLELRSPVRFVHTSSASAKEPLPAVSVYSAAMRAKDSLVGSWQRELSTQFGSLVTVNAVRPGFIPNDQNRAMLLDETQPDGYTLRGRTVVGATPLNRFGGSGEIAPAYVFLCSDWASFAGGAIFTIDGGYGCRGGL